eukprot:scaffold67256_cov30-Prasinocladus_malaysianus.AAC.1
MSSLESASVKPYISKTQPQACISHNSMKQIDDTCHGSILPWPGQVWCPRPKRMSEKVRVYLLYLVGLRIIEDCNGHVHPNRSHSG